MTNLTFGGIILNRILGNRVSYNRFHQTAVGFGTSNRTRNSGLRSV